MNVVAEAQDGREAVDAWRRLRPDITLMDLRLPDVDGVSAIGAIRAIEPKARIVILTTFDGDADIHRGICAGARSYLIKDVRREDLFACIREVHAGRSFIMPEVAQRLAAGISEVQLSNRELAVLRLLTAGQPNKLIGAALDIAEVTVKSHVQAIFRKLNVMSRTEAALVAQRRGWLHL